VTIRRYAAGFTLIESLAALVLLGIVIPVAMRAISVSLHVAAASADRTRAVMLAEARLDDLIITGDWQTTGRDGDFEDMIDQSMFDEVLTKELSRYTWKAEVDDWDNGDAQLLHVSVYWDRRDVEHSVTLTTLVQDVVE
jgi:general secretion pathway protein I